MTPQEAIVTATIGIIGMTLMITGLFGSKVIPTHKDGAVWAYISITALTILAILGICQTIDAITYIITAINATPAQ
jgi:hypothetical protein